MSAVGFIPIVTDGLVFQVDASNKLSFSDESLDIVDSNIKLHWDFSKITGLNNLDDILAVPDQSGNGYTGTSAVGEEFVFLENYTDQNLSVGDDITSANGVQTSPYSADGILELLIMYSSFDYSNGNRFSMPTSISPLVNGITINHTTATTFRSVNKWQGTATQETSTWTIPDQSIDSLHIYALKISVSNKLMELFVDGVSYGTKPINASATSILATLGDTYLGHGQSGATGSGNINYGEMFVAEGVYSSSKIIEYSNRLTNKWGNLFTKNIVAPTQIGAFTNGASVVDNAYSFDGTDDYISCPLLPIADLGSTFSFEQWIYIDTFLGEYRTEYNDNANNRNFLIKVINGNPKLLRTTIINASATDDLTATTEPIAATWYHIGCSVVENGNAKLYINGVLEDTIAITTLTSSVTDGFNIGCDRSAVGNFFNGKVSNMKIYGNKELTQQDFEKNYEATKHRFE